MIDLQSESIVTLSEATKLIPGRQGRPPHVSTLFRWISRGIQCGDERVFLESIRIGGVRATSVQALTRFVELASRTKGDGERRLVRTNGTRAQSVERALGEIGI